MRLMRVARHAGSKPMTVGTGMQSQAQVAVGCGRSGAWLWAEWCMVVGGVVHGCGRSGAWLWAEWCMVVGGVGAEGC
jgi:hypothetical protein